MHFSKTSAKPDIDVELFLSNYYFYYTNKVLQGIDDTKSDELGWYLPREKKSYITYLDSLLVDPKLIDKKERHIEQYYKLKTVLKDTETSNKKAVGMPLLFPLTLSQLSLETVQML